MTAETTLWLDPTWRAMGYEQREALRKTVQRGRLPDDPQLLDVARKLVAVELPPRRRPIFFHTVVLAAVLGGLNVVAAIVWEVRPAFIVIAALSVAQSARHARIRQRLERVAELLASMEVVQERS